MTARYLVTVGRDRYVTSTLAEAKAVERAAKAKSKRKVKAKRRNGAVSADEPVEVQATNARGLPVGKPKHTTMGAFIASQPEAVAAAVEHLPPGHGATFGGSGKPGAYVWRPPHGKRRNPAKPADETLRQLGGWGRLKAMLGTRYVFSDKGGDALLFDYKAPQPAKHGNWCVIEYVPGLDLYLIRIEYRSRDASKPIKTIAEFSNVYADQLRPIFERTTGLYLSL